MQSETESEKKGCKDIIEGGRQSYFKFFIGHLYACYSSGSGWRIALCLPGNLCIMYSV